MKEQDTTRILDVKINRASINQVLENIKIFLLSGSQHHIITLNPEMVVEAQKDIYFKKIINESDLSIADGIGIIFANMFLNNRSFPERIHGIDLVYGICEADIIENKRLYLLGAGEGIAEKAAIKLQKKYPHLQIAGAEEGIAETISNDKFQMTNKFSILNFKSRCNNTISDFEYPISNNNIKYDELNNAKLIERINNAKPNIIFVAFGAPKQEKWIYENLKKLPSVRLAIGVGGSFDFISGKIKRAPMFIRKLKVEWLWRLIQEPKRAGRIYNATIKFSWLILKRKLQ